MGETCKRCTKRVPERREFLLAMREANAAREELAHWMMDNGFATGHGDSLSDLLSELTWQIKELRTESK